jgi:hypothetical protein
MDASEGNNTKKMRETSLNKTSHSKEASVIKKQGKNQPNKSNFSE